MYFLFREGDSKTAREPGKLRKMAAKQNVEWNFPTDCEFQIRSQSRKQKVLNTSHIPKKTTKDPPATSPRYSLASGETITPPFPPVYISVPQTGGTLD